MQATQSSPKKDAITVDEGINQDNAWHMVKDVTNMTIVKNDIHEQESGSKTVNISLISFNSNHSLIIAKLKPSSKQAIIMVSCKVDMGCDGNTMLFNVFKK